MRQHVDLVEKGISDEGVGSAEWRKSVLFVAMDRDDASFSMLEPNETGLEKTVYVSANPKFPVFIIDDRIGVHYFPTGNSQVVMLGENTHDSEEERWGINNLAVLSDYCDQKLSTMELIDRQKKGAREPIFEMANFDRGDFGAPLAFFVRPEPNVGQHDYRLKINANYRQKFDANDCFSVSLRPDVRVVSQHSSGEVSKADIEGMVKWIEQSKKAFIDFIEVKLTRKGLRDALEKKPYGLG